MWKEAVVLISVLACAAAWARGGPLEPKPEKFKDIEGCYDSETDTMIPFNETVRYSKGCYKAECTETFITYIGCQVPHTPEHVGAIEFNDKPFPECCYRQNPIDKLCVDSGHTELCDTP